MFIYVGGISGVGKTTLISRTINLARKRGIKLEGISDIPIFCELAGVASAARLVLLPFELRYKLQPEVNRRLYEIDRLDSSTIRLNDNHFAFFDSSGKMYAQREIQPWDKKQLGGMVLIVAKPQTIFQQRLKNINTRPDRRINIDVIKLEQYKEREIAELQADQLGYELCIISNNDETSTPTSEEILLAYSIRQSITNNG